MRRSFSQRSRFEACCDDLPNYGTTRATARLPLLRCVWKAGIGALASVLALGVGMSGDFAESDHSLLGKHVNWVESVAFDPGGRWVASAGGDRGAFIWDPKRGNLAAILGRAAESEEGMANCVAFMPGGSTLAVAKDDGTVTLWDMAIGRERHSFRASEGGVRCLAFSPDGLVLATGSLDHRIAIWDVATSSRRAVLLGNRRQVNCVAFSPDGRTLASAGTDGTARLWDVSSGENIRTLNATTIHFRSVNCVAYSADGRVLAAACPESGIALWDAATGRRLEGRARCEAGAMTVAF
jgi:hypothetical protein